MGAAASTFEAECHPPATCATGNSIDKWKSDAQLSHSGRHLAQIGAMCLSRGAGREGRAITNGVSLLDLPNVTERWVAWCAVRRAG
jgi:hypothetical protein